MKIYLNILGITYGLSKDEIKTVYYKKSMEIHPDRNIGGTRNYEKEMMELNGAYSYIIENFEDYQNNETVIRETSTYFFNEGLVVLYLGNYEIALKKFEKAIELNSSYTDAYYMKGITFEKLRNYEEAILIYDMIIKIDETYYKAYYRKGKLLEILGQEEKAIFFINKFLEHFGGAIECYEKSIECFKRKNYQQAVSLINRTIKLKPNYENAYILKQEILTSIGDLKAAEEVRFDYLEKNGSSGEVSKEARRLYEKDDYINALRLFERYLKINVNDLDTLKIILSIQEKLNYFEESRKTRARIDILEQANLLEIWGSVGIPYGEMKKMEEILTQGKLCIEQGDYEKAIKIFDSFILLYPENLEGYNNKGIALYKSGNIQEAEELFDISTIKSNDYNLIKTRGKVLMEQGFYMRGLKLLYKAGELMNGNTDIELHLMKATILEKLGRFGEAIFEYDIMLSFQPNNNEFIKKREKLFGEFIDGMRK